MVLAKHVDELRYGALAADFRQRIDRALADPPILIVGGSHELIDRPFIPGSHQYLDRGSANVLVFVIDQCEHGVHHPRAADLRQCVSRAAADPPVVIFDGVEEILHRIDVADFVQDFDGGTPRVFGLVF